MKNYFLVLGIVLIAAVMMSSVLFVGGQSTLQFYLSFHDPTVDWGQPMKTGLADAAKEFGFKAEMIGPTPMDAVKQLEQIKTLVDAGMVDGIGIAPLDAKTFLPYIDELMDKGIPVVTVTSDIPESKRLATYGQTFESLEKISYDQAKMLIKTLGPDPKGDVAILNVLPDLEGLIMRENGTKRAIAEYPGLNLLGTYGSTIDFDKCYADIEALVSVNPNIVAIFAEDATTTPSLARVLRDKNLNDKIKSSGYDMTEESLLFVKSGNLDILVGQNPYAQGYLSMRALYEYIVDGKKPVSVDVEPEYADKSNIDKVLEAYGIK